MCPSSLTVAQPGCRSVTGCRLSPIPVAQVPHRVLPDPSGLCISGGPITEPMYVAKPHKLSSSPCLGAAAQLLLAGLTCRALVLADAMCSCSTAVSCSSLNCACSPCSVRVQGSVTQALKLAQDSTHDGLCGQVLLCKMQARPASAWVNEINKLKHWCNETSGLHMLSCSK